MAWKILEMARGFFNAPVSIDGLTPPKRYPSQVRIDFLRVVNDKEGRRQNKFLVHYNPEKEGSEYLTAREILVLAKRIGVQILIERTLVVLFQADRGNLALWEELNNSGKIKKI